MRGQEVDRASHAVGHVDDHRVTAIGQVGIGVPGVACPLGLGWPAPGRSHRAELAGKAGLPIATSGPGRAGSALRSFRTASRRGLPEPAPLPLPSTECSASTTSRPALPSSSSRLNISRLVAALLGIAKLRTAGRIVQSMTAASLRSVIGKASSCSSQIRCSFSRVSSRPAPSRLPGVNVAGRFRMP